MKDKFQNKYRIPSARLQNWDYGSNAPYFVTICTKNRVHYFGEIVYTAKLAVYTMQLSEIGTIAQQFWMEIPKHFPFVHLHEFVVMPNHVHGILVFNKPDDTSAPTVETPKLGVSTTAPQNRTAGASTKWKPGTLGVVINQYKRICTIHARKINANFDWQSRFHDHIIRNDESYQKIKNYIQTNPAKWNDDKFNTD